MAAKWNPRQEKFIEWLALPKSKRTPPTHEEFADAIGVTSRTLRNWKKLPGFWPAVWELAEWHLSDWLPDIFDALGRKAAGGDVGAMRLALEAIGTLDIQGKVQVTISPYTIEELTQARKLSQAWDSEHSDE